jgi:hypothetical protein
MKQPPKATSSGGCSFSLHFIVNILGIYIYKWHQFKNGINLIFKIND